MDKTKEYKSYQRLDFAETECRNNTECIGIYDENCDKDGPFLQITDGYMDSGFGPNCVYKKRSYRGKRMLSDRIFFFPTKL